MYAQPTWTAVEDINPIEAEVPPTATAGVSGLNFNITYGAGVPDSAKTVIAAVTAFLQANFYDAVTVNLTINWGSLGTNVLGQTDATYFNIPGGYTAIATNLNKQAISDDDVSSVASIPGTDPVTGTHSWLETSAQYKAQGGSYSGTDATITFSSTSTFDYDDSNGVSTGAYDFQAIVAHEVSEAMGRVLFQNTSPYDQLVTMSDLFKFSAAGVHVFSGTTAGYFSVDNGTTSLAAYNTTAGGDWGDWSSSPTTSDAFRAFITTAKDFVVTEADLKALDVIGWDRIGAAPTLDLDTGAAGTGRTATFTEMVGTDTGADAVAFAAGGTGIADADTAKLAGLSVSIDSTTVGTGDQLLVGSTAIDLTTTATSGQVTFNSTFFSYSVSDAGSTRTIHFTSLTGSGGTTAAAVTASYEALLDALKFNNTSDSPVDGSTRSFSVTVNDGFSDSTAATFAVTLAAVADSSNHSPTGAVNVTGTATQGQVLTADTSTLADADGLGTLSYQWLRGGNAISGATSNTYTLVQADVGAHISVRVSYTDGGNTAESVTSSATAAVANVNDLPTGGVTITGTATQNQVLSANTSTLADADGLGTLSYQWLRDGNSIGGATASTYTLVQADVNHQVSVRVSYTDGGGTAESVTSSATSSVANVNDAPTGSVTVTGTAAQGQLLSANTSTLADADGLGTFSYQWLRNGSTIGGANASTYTLGQSDVGAKISVTVSYTDGFGHGESVTSSQTATVANVNDAPTGGVTVTGTATQGQVLSANTSTLADADGLGTLSYQWLRDGNTIGSATAATYTLVQADVGHQISVRVSYTDGGGTGESVTSGATAAVANVNDAPTGSVTVTGTATQGQSLSANTSTLADADGLGAFSYQWLRDGNSIGGASSSSYTLVQGDVGHQISVRVSYTDGFGASESVTSGATSAVANVNDAPTGAVTVTGTATQGQLLSANTSTLADADGLGTLSYQWLRDGNTIGGASSSSYTLVQADVGHQVSVRVSYTDGGGTAESVTSAATSAVANVNDAPTGGVTVTGTATQGQVLSANTSTLADADGLGTLSYQWLRDGNTIGGASSSSYTLVQADVGHQISVRVSYTDGGSTAESVTSSATAAVANVNDAPTGTVSITGTVTQGQQLTADASAVADADGLGAFSYQWLRDGSTIAGANSSSYTLVQSDVGAHISVTVSYTDGFGHGESVTSSATAAVTNVNDAPTGNVTVTGTATQGQVLSANTSTLADADGLGTLSYQWLRDGSTIGGANASSYTLTQADVGAHISVRVSYTDGGGTGENVTSAATSAVANVNDAPTGGVGVSGTATQGQVLSANTSSLADADGLGAFSYQWLRDGNTIAGANSSSYTLVQGDVGAHISVTVSYTDGFGHGESVTSSATTAVTNVNDAPTGGVGISGTATQGQVLSANTSTLADADGLGALSYQWLRDGNTIGGASSSSYTLVQGDVGAHISVTVSYTDGFGHGESVTSSATTAVTNVNDAPTGGVGISGTATQGQVLSANTSTLADADGLGTLSYQWLRDGNTIGGASSSSYTLVQADVGHQITVRVSYTDGGGTAESVTSSATAAVANVNDAPVGSVSITGTATQGQQLTADASAVTDADGLGAFSYQWLRDGNAIGGATASSYTLVQADVGAHVSVRVSYTDGGGTAESVTSGATGAVANVNDAPTGDVTISGTATQNSVLTADVSTLADADGLGTLSYQWLRDGNAIGGATSSTYTLVHADVGAQVSVRVSYTDGGGTAESVTSGATSAVVASANNPPTGAVDVTGTASQGSVLSADTVTLADADGLGTLSYQWLRDGADITNATASTYTLTQADVGAQVSVRVSYTDGANNNESVTSAVTSPVANVNDAPTGSVTVSGIATQGQVLSADASSVADADGLGAFSYQWLRNGNAIGGANAATYTLVQADVGAQVSVKVSYTDGFGAHENVTSSQTAAVANVNDAPTGGVTVTGTASQGQVLTADTSTLADADGLGTLSYQWLRDGNAIGGASASTYTLTQADVGAHVSVRVSYTDGGSAHESVTSTATSAVANVNDAPTGGVTVTGTATQGLVLSANTSTLADADGLGTLSYQWLRDGNTIGGATSNTYTLGQADVGSHISVRVSYTDGFSTAESVTSGATAAVANVNDAPTGGVAVAGTATQGQQLSADTSALADADGLGTLSYQWLRNGNAIGGASASSYTLTQADVGTHVSVRVSYTDGFGAPESVTSAATATVANVNDAPTGGVNITGAATQGHLLSADTTTLADADGLGTLSYQWLRDGNTIAGASSSSYSLVQADVGTHVSVRVSYTDGGGTSESVTSGTTAAVANVNDAPTGSVTVTGTATQGQVLSAVTSTLADADGLGVLSFQWLRNGNAIGGATSSSYTLVQSDVGAHVSVRVSYTDGFGTVENVTSTATGTVANVNDAPTGGVAITGTATQGQVLSADTSTLADADGLGTLSYQWLRGGSAIAGATSGTYTLAQADVGAQVSVRVSYTDGGGTSESVTSASTAAVANVNDAPTGSVTITGTPVVGHVLAADTSSIADADGLGVFSFQWFADGLAIGGATDSTFAVTGSQKGESITVTVAYVDGFGTPESLTSPGTVLVTPPSGKSITGTARGDFIEGGDDNDTLTGLGGVDTIVGGSGDDIINGGASTDDLDGQDGSDLYLIAGGSEHPAAEIHDTGAYGTDEVRFTATSTGTLTLFAGDTGIERVVIGTGAKDAADRTATTALSVDASAVLNALAIYGNAGANQIIGTAFADTIDGGGGVDKLTGGAGDDTYIVDNSRDTVTEAAGGGTDVVLASASFVLSNNVENLVLTGDAAIDGTGNAQANVITGNDAANFIDGKGGIDALDGGDGGDVYVITAASDHPAAEITDTGTTGVDEVRFAATTAGTLTLFAGDTGIEEVTIGTGTGADAATNGKVALNVDASAVGNALFMLGNSGNNVITGTAFNDTIDGGIGNDALSGGAGNDVIFGGAGSDTLSGGSGADTFVFNTVPSTRSGVDTITDFTSGVDSLHFSLAVFNALGATGPLSSGEFFAGAGAVRAQDADDRFIYNTTTGVLYYDADGTGRASAVAVAILGTAAHPDLAFSDILVVS